MNKMLVGFLISSLSFSVAHAQTVAEAKTNAYFERIKSQPEKVFAFVHAMPKGGDLHLHQSGAAYAENLLFNARNDQLCINKTTFVAYADAACTSDNLLMNVIKDPAFYDQVIDAWSMRHFKSGSESGHDHFFATFGKFGALTNNHSGELLAEITKRAERENELYVEVMSTLDGKEASTLGASIGWDPDFNKMREKLLASGIDTIVQHISANMDQYEADRQSTLQCDKDKNASGCHMTVRYLYQVLREQAPEKVFAQFLTGFEAASKDSRIVGLNLVQPEDGLISMRDYQLQMQIIGYLHEIYPNVKISLHAGELSKELVPAEGLSFHINDAVNVAKANRIGHGVDIQYEKDMDALLTKMANDHVLVEINLTSNDAILNVKGENHPLSLYMQRGVPITLSTDDEGVARSNLTMEYKRAVDTYHFSYDTLKQFSRNSLTYSFLKGESLWQDTSYKKIVNECIKDKPDMRLSSACESFLEKNEKAKLQWELENKFAKFESRFK